MRFEELTTKHQEFLMYCLFDHIKRKVKEEERDQIIEEIGASHLTYEN